MLIRLDTQRQNVLLNKPESGMGYQVVDATLTDNSTRRGIVYNAELFATPDELHSLSVISYRRNLEVAKSSASIKTLAFVPGVRASLSRDQFRSLSIKIEKSATPADEAPKENTKQGEVFKRFSARADDKRLNSDGSWRDGTYATTEEDAKNVKTGKDAVARYALPSPEPACYVFTGKPDKDTVIQRGICAPKNDQPGGGVEVFFAEGTQPNTVTGPETIPAG